MCISPVGWIPDRMRLEGMRRPHCISSPIVQDVPRIYRLGARLTPRQRRQLVLVAVGAAVLALLSIGLAVAGVLSSPAALGSLVPVALGAVAAQLAVRGTFSHLLEPKEYREAIARLEAGDRAGALEAVQRAIARVPD